MGPEDRGGAGPDTQRTLMCARVEKAFAESRHRKSAAPGERRPREAEERGWSDPDAPSRTPTATRGAPYW
ncbi:hypothetical protein EYF80_066387 [Liparis tanakae]|uniref:Uncharacterized protein n=1 Tax=Liparis tanakae TaxID=230148 RepID=A0A4Z2E570_9TELE|nr:hypothetical protein EYF80_066387 [Liparis tanakae]